MSSRGKSDGMINNVNAFALLGKKKTKGKSSAAKPKSGGEKVVVEEKVFWAPAPLNAKSWADVDDEDDDDYYATTAPPVAVWASNEQQTKEESLVLAEESESDEDILGVEETELYEEHDSETEVEKNPEPVVKSVATVIAVKEPERQLSKKEIRKKEQEAFEATLAELNIITNDSNGHDVHQVADVKKKELQPTLEGEKDKSVTAESKNSKKKKKKAKSSAKEVKDIQNHEEDNSEKIEENVAASVDVKEQLKKLASMKKKKPSREADTTAKAAAAEAAARRQKLEAAKKKEKSHHYNQQPVR